MEILILIIFACMLIGCIAAGLSIIIALGAGYLLFLCYGLKKGFSLSRLFRISLEGVRTVKNVLITFALIGMLTAVWRSAGTIPSIVCYVGNLFSPSVFLLLIFLLNCLVSFITGTSFGTSATMGVICMTIALSMGISPVLTGGAILAGAFFGDRCSPVSTSALLVAEITKTDIYRNIRLMFRTAIVPFAAACIIYLVMGWIFPPSAGQIPDINGLFSTGFIIGLLPLIPAAAILIASLCRVRVQLSMGISIVLAMIICLTVQHMPFTELLLTMLRGYRSPVPEIAGLMNGGGIVSMITVAANVCIASAFSGILRETGLLDPIIRKILRWKESASAFSILLPISVGTCMISCNQSLAILLTRQLGEYVEPDPQQLAIDLENTAVVIAPLIPWSIAGAVPLAAIGAPVTAIAAACYLYLLPLWNWIVSLRRHKNIK